MMRNKWIAVLLILILLLSGCKDGNGEPTVTTTASAATTVTTTTAQTTTAATTAASKPQGGKVPGKLDGVTGSQKEEEDPVLKATRDEIIDNDALFGVAYLGYAELPYWEDVCVYIEANGYTDAFPYLADVEEDHAVLQEGGEVYAVIPADKDVKLTVSDFGFKDDSDVPERGKDLLTVTDGKPILLRGNISEIVSNILITAEKGKDTLEYNPCLSGMDGSLVTDDGVYDLTNYELVWGTYPGEPDPAFTLNTWYAQHEAADGNLYAMTLTLDRDGTVAYYYGWPNSGIVEVFEGTWSEGSEWNELTLDLAGGPVDPEGNAIAKEQYEISCDFTWDFTGSSLEMHHEDGDLLLYGTEGEWFEFMPFNGFHMVEEWTSENEARGWTYELHLFENTECWFVIGETDGEVLAFFEGWWYLEEDNTIRLNMLLTDGEHPENAELEYFYGEYLVEDWNPNHITLSYVSGEILTLEMEEDFVANFDAI